MKCHVPRICTKGQCDAAGSMSQKMSARFSSMKHLEPIFAILVQNILIFLGSKRMRISYITLAVVATLPENTK